MSFFCGLFYSAVSNAVTSYNVDQNMKNEKFCPHFTLENTWDLAARELSDC
jgi:hypothetical protein